VENAAEGENMFFKIQDSIQLEVAEERIIKIAVKEGIEL